METSYIYGWIQQCIQYICVSIGIIIKGHSVYLCETHNISGIVGHTHVFSTSNIGKSRSPVTYFKTVNSFNTAHGTNTAVCSVECQNDLTTNQLTLMLWTSEFLRDLSLSWGSVVGEGGAGCILYCNGPWWRHQMKTFSALLALCAGVDRLPVNSQHKGQLRGALMFSSICTLNKRLSKQPWCWWFETPLRSLWRHCNGSGFFGCRSSAYLLFAYCISIVLYHASGSDLYVSCH